MFGWVVGAVIGAYNLYKNDRNRRKANTEIDERLRALEKEELRKEEARLQENLAQLHALYQDYYSGLSSHKDIVQEYYLTIKAKLDEEKIVIENLPEILKLLDSCARNDNAVVIAGLEKFRKEIMALLHWGLMHIAILAGNEPIYKRIISLCGKTINYLELDPLGHSILEYAYLLGDQQLISELTRNHLLLQQSKNLEEARLTLIAKRIFWKIPDNRDNSEILECLTRSDYAAVEALITIGAVPADPTKIIELIQKLFYSGQNRALKKLIMTNPGHITLKLIDTLETTSPVPRGPYKQDCLDCLRAFFWLNKEGFTKINEPHLQTDELPVDVAIKKDRYHDFVELVKCGANLDQVNMRGETTLMVAVKENREDIIQYLIETLRIDPRFYNSKYTTAFALLPQNQRFNRLLINHANSLYSQEQKEQERKKLSKGSFVSYKEFLTQAGYFYNLWRQGKIQAKLARMPMVLGLYVLGIQQTLPWGRDELPWLAKKLNLKVRLLPDNQEFNRDIANAEWINVVQTEQGYQAKWSSYSVEAYEPTFQFYRHTVNDLSLNISQHTAYDSAKSYIYNNYICLERFFEKHHQWQQSSLDEWRQSAKFFVSLARRDYLPKADLILAKPQVFKGTKFNHYYQMPTYDAGYQAIGISRISAAKLLLDYLSSSFKPKVFNCIKVEWVNWITSFTFLPSDLFGDAKEILSILKDYHVVIQSLHKDPNNNTASNIISTKKQQLYQLASKEHCAAYIAKIIATPHNYLNQIKYYPAQHDLPTGGTLAALAEIIEFNVNVWKGNAEQIDCVFNYSIQGVRKTINIWQKSSFDHHLHQVAILSENNELQARPVITHIDLFSDVEPDTDLGVILHGWFSSFANGVTVTPQNDLLALLLKVKSIMENRQNKQNLLKEIEQYRHELSNELSTIFSNQIKDMQTLDQHWATIADQQVRAWARKHLLKEHSNLIEHYKSQVEVLQEQTLKELNNKIGKLEKDRSNNIFQVFEQPISALEDWYKEQEAFLRDASNKNQAAIKSSISHELAIEHAAVKKQYKKALRGTIISGVVTPIITKFLPTPTNFPQAVTFKVGTDFFSSVVKGDKSNFRSILVNSAGCVFNQFKFQQDLMQTALVGMVENAFNGFVLKKRGKDIASMAALGGIQEVLNFAFQNHLEISPDYLIAISHGLSNSVLEGLKLGLKKPEDFVELALQNMASNINEVMARKEALEAQYTYVVVEPEGEQEEWLSGQFSDMHIEELGQNEIREGISLQENQAALINRLTEIYKKRAHEYFMSTGIVLNTQQNQDAIHNAVDNYIKSLDSNELRKLDKALDIFEYPQSGKVQATSVVIAQTIIPLARLIRYGVPLLGVYFTTTKAVTETAGILQQNSEQSSPNNNAVRFITPELILEQALSQIKQDDNLLFLFRGTKDNKDAEQKGGKEEKKQTEADREKNIAKGIPESVLGPSGKPKIHIPKYPSRKKATDGAIDRGVHGETPEEHVSPVKGEPHFHPSGSNSKEHHSYPSRTPKYHPPKHRNEQ